jgi:NADH:ubiquinone oxidoreductase subunit 2 (subunit N)
VNAVIALVYYARVVKSVYMDDVPVTVPVDRAVLTEIPRPLGLAIGITAAVVIVVGFFPQMLGFFGEVTERLVAGP